MIMSQSTTSNHDSAHQLIGLPTSTTSSSFASSSTLAPCMPSSSTYASSSHVTNQLTSMKDWFTYVYKIDNIQEIIQQHETQQNFIQSQIFSFKNHCLSQTKQNSNWRLIFYPNGAGGDCKNFLSIFLKVSLCTGLVVFHIENHVTRSTPILAQHEISISFFFFLLFSEIKVSKRRTSKNSNDVFNSQ